MYLFNTFKDETQRMLLFMIWKLSGKMQLLFFLSLAVTCFPAPSLHYEHFFDYKNEIFHKLVLQTELWVYDGEWTARVRQL